MLCPAMGRLTGLLLLACFFQHNLAQSTAPLLASSNICKFNPTQNTIALEKPYCFITSPYALTVYLYVVRSDALSTVTSNSTYKSTQGGYSGPYVAAVFGNPNCTNPPTTSQIYDSSQVQATLDNYVVRVGNDLNCFNIFPCNGPLQSNTAYSFKYVFYNGTVRVTESAWSSLILTKQGKDFGNIDIWPGRRSGGMIVITSILSVLTFFVLAGLVAALITTFMNPSPNLEPRRHETQTTHEVPHKTEGGVEYATALSVTERYSTNPQP